MQERRRRGGRDDSAWARLVFGGAPLNQRRPPGVLSPPSYYAYPPLKRPHWRWEVVGYFYVGGIASAAFVIATIADWLGRPEDRAISRAGRYLALAGMLVTPLLLIRDLGRPERFHHMLRLVKPRSPMSMGSWAITLFGAAAGLAAVGQVAADGWLGTSRPARLLAATPQRPLGLAGSLVAFFVGSYTGVLLAFTNVPFWARNRLWLGPLFLSSAVSTALAAIALVLEMGRRPAHAPLARLHRADVLALAAEMGLLAASEVALGDLARPLTAGRLARPYRLGVQAAGLLLPLLLQLPAYGARPLPRPVSLAAGALVLAGGLLLRWLILEAGKLSADDPAAYFAMTRDPAASPPAPVPPAAMPGGTATPGPAWWRAPARWLPDPRAAWRARRLGAPPATPARVSGVLTIVQEDRIRLVDAAGRGYLFTVGKRVRWSVLDLRALVDAGRRVTVTYHGTPDLGAVAIDLRVDA
jgi:formate-dependent nitrite reductase membrane component NrfD